MYFQTHHTHQGRRQRAGFTLIEVLVSISIIALLSSVVMAATNTARKNARDSKRISSIREIQTALELYFTDHQSYPDADTSETSGLSSGTGGVWDTPQDGDFLQVLVDGKYLQGTVLDPLNETDSQYNLRYYKFPAGALGCPENRGSFYVLGIADMETSNGRHQLSPGWSCPAKDGGELLDFGDPTAPDTGFEFVVGKYES